jgi:antitoxin PrlF
MANIAKLTSKGQVTVPKAVRDAFHLTTDSLLAWELMPDGSARVRPVQPLEVEYLRALESTLTEWTSDEDETAYRDL